MKRILLIEDNKDHSQMFKQVLEEDGYHVTTAMSGLDAVKLIEAESYDLIITDLMLPDMSGESIIRLVRKMYSMPILVVSSKNRDADKIFNLNLGADDYLVKPFSLKELVARVKAILRRSTPQKNYVQGLIELDKVTINMDNYMIEKQGQKYPLTRTEFAILQLLITHMDQVVTKEEIYANVWHKPFKGDNNLLNVNIHRIRQKLEEDADDPKILLSVWGVGYKFVKQG